jgi:hypothetical protein
MWIATATCTPAHEQGIASTTLNVGNAIGLAVFTAIADIGTEGTTGEALRAATTDGEFFVVLLTAVGMVAGIVATHTLRRRAEASAPVPVANL